MIDEYFEDDGVTGRPFHISYPEWMTDSEVCYEYVHQQVVEDVARIDAEAQAYFNELHDKMFPESKGETYADIVARTLAEHLLESGIEIIEGEIVDEW